MMARRNVMHHDEQCFRNIQEHCNIIAQSATLLLNASTCVGFDSAAITAMSDRPGRGAWVFAYVPVEEMTDGPTSSEQGYQRGLEKKGFQKGRRASCWCHRRRCRLSRHRAA